MDEAGRAFGSTSASVHNTHIQASHNQQQSTPQYPQHSVSPAPIQYHQHGQQTASYTPQTHTSSFTQPPTTSHTDHYSAPQNRYAQQPTSARLGNVSGTNPVAQRSTEVWRLSDSANATIPDDIRQRFQRDEQGHVLFFTTPPLDVLPPTREGGVEGHTLKYRAAKLKQKLEAKMKRKADVAELQETEAQSKKRKLDEGIQIAEDLEALEKKAILAFVKQMDEGTDEIYKRDFGDLWQEAKALATKNRERLQAEEQALQKQLAESERKRKEKQRILLEPTTMWSKGPFLDDFDPRY